MKPTLFSVCLLFFASACSLTPSSQISGQSDWRNTNILGKYGNMRYREHHLPPAEELYQIWAGGPTNAPNVIISVGSIPQNSLKFDFEALYNNLSDPSQWMVAELHTQHSYLPGKLLDTNYTLEDAQRDSAWSSTAIFKVAKYFHEQDKSVYIFAQNYGAMLTLKMISDWKYENYVKKILLIDGRLATPENAVDSLAKGMPVEFQTGPSQQSDLLISHTFDEIELNNIYQASQLNNIVTIEQYYNLRYNSNLVYATLMQFNYLRYLPSSGTPVNKILFSSSIGNHVFGSFSEEEAEYASLNSVYYSSLNDYDYYDLETMLPTLQEDLDNYRDFLESDFF